MHLSNPAGYFAIFLLGAVLVIGCGRSEVPSESDPFIQPESTRKTPFPAKEPDIYSATYSLSAGSAERSIRVTRNGSLLRIDYDPETDRHFVVIESDVKYLALPAQRIYTEIREGDTGLAAETEGIRSLLAINPQADYESLGIEEGLAKYVVRSDKNGLSEAVVFVDEAIGMPVRLEFYTGLGEEKAVAYSVRMIEFSKEVGEETFKIDSKYKRIALEEFYRRLKR
jgi:hypothetical protein